MPEPMKKWPRAWVGREITEWVINGCTLPPPQLVKTLTLAHLVQSTGIKRFIETGTLTGNTSGMISLIPGVAVDTIELSEHYYKKAAETLSHHPNVTQHLGDSADVLPRLLAELREPAVFWLDAHYSGGMTAKAEKATPIQEELLAILEHPVPGHVVVIDDIRGFRGTDDYPDALDMQKRLEAAKPGYQFINRYDIAIFAPRETVTSLGKFAMNESAVIAI